MKKTKVFGFYLYLLLHVSNIGYAHTLAGLSDGFLEAYVEGCADGDTCTLSFLSHEMPKPIPKNPLPQIHLPLFRIPARLFGIDCDEIIRPTQLRHHQPLQPFALAAREKTLSLVHHKVIRFRQWDMDSFHRLVGEIYYPMGGKTSQSVYENLALTLIQEGLCEVYRNISQATGRMPATLSLATDAYFKAQTHAKTHKLGIWKPGSKRISPYDYRHGGATNSARQANR